MKFEARSDTFTIINADALSKLSQIDLRGESLYNDARRGWVNLYGATHKFMRQSGWKQDPNPWYRKMADSFLFTFVRDPVDKFLSSFYEVHTRNHSASRVWTKLGVDQYEGMERMWILLQYATMKHNNPTKKTRIQLLRLCSAGSRALPRGLDTSAI